MKRRVAVDLSVLRESRDLRLLVIGELFSGLGAQAALVAIPYQIFVLTHSAARSSSGRCLAARSPTGSSAGG
jgi:hypothetical protein